MAMLNLLFSFIVLFLTSSSTPAHVSESYDSVNTFHHGTNIYFHSHRDIDTLFTTRTIGLYSNLNSLSPALLSCHILRLIIDLIVLPSNAVKSVVKKRQYNVLTILCRALIVLLLIISGNVHVHPGPVALPITVSTTNDLGFDDFCARKNLGYLHINARSLLPKMDQLKLWVNSSNPDVLVITETWLKMSIPYPDLFLPGYNLFIQDRSSKGGGVAIFTKEYLQCSVALAKSIPK